MENNVKNFSELDFSRLISEPVEDKNWSFGRGGNGLKDDEWTIVLYIGTGRDISWEIYKLPDFINEMLNVVGSTSLENGRAEIVSKFRNLLEIE